MLSKSIFALSIRRLSGARHLAPIVALAFVTVLPTLAQEPPEPPDPTPDHTFGNLFYGAIPPQAPTGPVLVFVPGLLETAQLWWDATLNDMYAYCYQAGYRTAFMSPNPNNLPTTTGTQTNAKMLERMMPHILSHYQVTQVYFIGHSLGGLDIQQMLSLPKYIGTAKAVFTLATPNQGDILANWLFSVVGEPTAIQLGWLIPGVQEVETQTVRRLRTQWDPIFLKSKIPFFTLSGNTYFGNPATQTTGPILTDLTGGFNAPPNDGVVDQPESLLPSTYSNALGVINGNHFDVAQGHNSFPYIYAQITRLERAR